MYFTLLTKISKDGEVLQELPDKQNFGKKVEETIIAS